jgi:hypothetical protein
MSQDPAQQSDLCWWNDRNREIVIAFGCEIYAVRATEHALAPAKKKRQCSGTLRCVSLQASLPVHRVIMLKHIRVFRVARAYLQNKTTAFAHYDICGNNLNVHIIYLIWNDRLHI